MKARILFVIADLVPFGPGEQATLIGSPLREQFEIDFFCCSRCRLNTLPAELVAHWYDYELGQRNWLGAARQLGRLLRRKEYALIHTWDRRSSTLAKCVLLAARGAARRAAWVRQADELDLFGSKSTRSSIPGIRSPDWILGDRWLLEASGVMEKSMAVPLAIPTRLEKNTVSRSAQQPTSTVKMIGTVCPLEAQSGLKHLIWSLDQIKCVRDDLRLVVWGTGSQESALRRYADQIGLGDWIQWRSPRRDVRSEMDGLDLYWHAPRTEAVSPVVVAAVMGGLPAIVPRTAASLEFAKTWSSIFATVPWGARDEIARQTQQWLQRGWTPMAPSVVAEWTRSRDPAVVAHDYALAYERILKC